jgi:uncharacterized protein
MKGRIVALGVLGAVMLGVAATHAEPAFPDMNGRLVMDVADLIPADRENALADELHRYSVTHGPQIAVVTIPSLEGADPVDYGNRLFRHLKLGDKKRNDGVLLMIAPAERKIRIEVGYGLEPQLTDAASNQINRTIIAPKLKAGDYPGGIEAGVAAIEKVVMPEPVTATAANTNRSESGSGVLFGMLLLVLGAGLMSWLIVSTVTRHQREQRLRAQRRAENEKFIIEQNFRLKRMMEAKAEAADAARASAAKTKRTNTKTPPYGKSAVTAAPYNNSTSQSDYQRREKEREEERKRRQRREDDDRRSRDSWSSAAAASSSSYDSGWGSSSSSSSSSDSSSSYSDSGSGGSSGGGGDTSSY